MKKRGRPSIQPKRCISGRGHTAPISRGLCPACYQRAWYQIKRDRTTWAKLERKGQALKAHPVAM